MIVSVSLISLVHKMRHPRIRTADSVRLISAAIRENRERRRRSPATRPHHQPASIRPDAASVVLAVVAWHGDGVTACAGSVHAGGDWGMVGRVKGSRTAPSLWARV